MATKFNPVPNVGSQIERAVIAFLKDAYADDASKYQFLFSNDWKTRKAPHIEVLAHKSTETVPHTGIETYAVRIEWKWKGTNQAGEENVDANWRDINAFVGVGMAAFSQTENNLGNADTLPATVAAEITRLGRALATEDPDHQADMADFTCSYVEYKAAQRAEQGDGTFFIKEVRNFEIKACPANVD